MGNLAEFLGDAGEDDVGETGSDQPVEGWPGDAQASGGSGPGATAGQLKASITLGVCLLRCLLLI